MYKIERNFGKTKIIMPGMSFTTDRINRLRYNELRKQAVVVQEEMDKFQNLLTRALSQGKRKG